MHNAVSASHGLQFSCESNASAMLSACNPPATDAQSRIQSSFFNRESHWIIKKPRVIARKTGYSWLIANATAKTENVNTEKEISDESSDVMTAAPGDSKEAAKLARRAEDWERALKSKESNSLHKLKVDSCNNGGLLVRFGTLNGFVPFSQISASRVPKDGKTMADVGKDLIGQNLSVKVLEVNKEDKRLVFSEKRVEWLQSVQQIKKGDVFEGRVNAVTDFGAFIDLRFPDGSYPVTGLVHVSELSWDRVYDPRAVVQEGQDVRVKVSKLDLERMRLALSMKQLQADPLLETLDTLMPQEDALDNNGINSEEDILNDPLPGLADICEELLQEDGIDEVTPGRMALEKRVVSQDLELWLSSAPVEDGNFTILARAGRQVQEVHLKTSLDREGIKAAVQRVTGRVP